MLQTLTTKSHYKICIALFHMKLLVSCDLITVLDTYCTLYSIVITTSCQVWILHKVKFGLITVVTLEDRNDNMTTTKNTYLQS